MNSCTHQLQKSDLTFDERRHWGNPGFDARLRYLAEGQLDDAGLTLTSMGVEAITTEASNGEAAKPMR